MVALTRSVGSNSNSRWMGGARSRLQRNFIILKRGCPSTPPACHAPVRVCSARALRCLCVPVRACAWVCTARARDLFSVCMRTHTFSSLVCVCLSVHSTGLALRARASWPRLLSLFCGAGVLVRACLCCSSSHRACCAFTVLAFVGSRYCLVYLSLYRFITRLSHCLPCYSVLVCSRTLSLYFLLCASLYCTALGLSLRSSHRSVAHSSQHRSALLVTSHSEPL